MFWKKSKITIEGLEQSVIKSEAELSFLHAKSDTYLSKLILNSTKSNISAVEEQGKFLQKLSGFNFEDRWPFGSEISSLNEYIKLFSKVMPDNIYHKIEFDVDNHETEIPVLILFPMVQNGLVNGYNTMENYPLKVKLKAKDNHIVYEVSNRVNHHLTNQADNKFISEFENRLQYHFGEDFNLIINSNSNLFKVTLLLKIK